MKIKTLVLEKISVASVAWFVGLLAIATAVPLFHSQPLTGPIVNATLFIATAVLGASNGIVIGLIPSLIALSFGLLPPVLAPMVPFIMFGNAILIIVFNGLKNKNFWLGVAAASFLKFLFLAGTSSVVINLLLKKEVAATVAGMMSWPQLYTALAGGLLAYFTLKIAKRI
ncbi:MAG: iron hydrogenase [bacterium]|nr:iron hydrogenase [bacterium]